MQHPQHTPRNEVRRTRRRRLARRARMACGAVFYGGVASAAYVADDWMLRAVVITVAIAIGAVHGLLLLAVSVLKASDTP
jgi:hypothetical protein